MLCNKCLKIAFRSILQVIVIWILNTSIINNDATFGFFMLCYYMKTLTTIYKTIVLYIVP